MRFLSILIGFYIRQQVMEVVLHWSTRWKKYSNEAFKDLRKEVNKSIDPGYPGGEESAVKQGYFHMDM